MATPPDPPFEAVDATLDAATALAALPADQRLAVTLHHLDGMTVPEVARLIRRSTRATESLVARGRRTLREHYGQDDGGR